MKPAVGGAMVKIDPHNNPFLRRAAEEGVSDGTYARFNGNSGQFITNGPEIEPGSEVVFDLFNCKLAWQGFDNDNRPHRGPEVSVVSGEVLADPPDDNPDVRWGKVIKVALMTLDGTQMMYTSKADKPTREIWRLIKRYGAEMMKNRDEAGNPMMPIIRMGARSFQIEVPDPQNEKRKIKTTKYSEEFNISGWMPMEEFSALVAGDDPSQEAPSTQEAGHKVVEPEIILPAPKPNVSGFSRRKPA